MNTGMYSTATKVEMNYHEPLPENSEEYGQKHGYAVVLPDLSGRIAFQAGQLLITIGQKLVSIGTKNPQFSKDMA